MNTKPTEQRGSWGFGTRKQERAVLIPAWMSVHFETGHNARVIQFDDPPVRTLEDMSTEEIACMCRQYGTRVSGKRYEWGL